MIDPSVILGAGLAPAPGLLNWPVNPSRYNATILRGYQQDILCQVSQCMALGLKRILIVLPTGGGKTVLANSMLHSALAAGLHATFMVHRRELLKQTSKTLLKNDLPHSFIASGHPFDSHMLLNLAGVQTLIGKLTKVWRPSLLVVDEAHHCTSKTWAQVFDFYSDSFIVGLTATPQRLDGRGLGEYFDVMIVGPSVSELMALGYLCQYDYFAPDVPDTVGLSSQMGDYARDQAAALMQRPMLLGNVVKNYLDHAAGKPGIFFAQNIQHSLTQCDAFMKAGVKAVHIDGTMSQTQRDDIDEAFRARDFDILCNVDLLGEGYDVPEVVYCGLGRITKSLSIHKQQLGRAMRPKADGGRAVFCDHAGNALRGLGLPDSDCLWSLEGKKKRSKGGNDDATPVKQCMGCFLVVPSMTHKCPRCGTEFPVNKNRDAATDESVKLSKLEKAELKARKQEIRKAEERACKDYADFFALGVKRNYESPMKWAKIMMKVRRGYGRY